MNSSSFVDSNPLSHFTIKTKPDVSVYPPTTSDSVKTNSALVEIFIEFKWNSLDDPFGEVHEAESGELTFLRNSKCAKDTLGQITSYAAAHLGSQFRTHIFSVFILKDSARLLRWDRSGTIVTEAFKYNESDLLAEFFFRYSKASDAMRGKDESVSDASPAEKSVAREALQLDETVPLVKLSIPDEYGLRYFVAPAPQATPYTPPGRATRGFKSYDILQGKVVFVKDSWRIDLPDILAEGQIYKMLRDANVDHVPHCVASGDIASADFHATRTQTYTEKPWARILATQLIPHRHYRLCLDLVGRIIVEYRNSYEMVSALRDALIGEFSQCGLS